ncbi:MAG: peptidoglycan DD-metalloendopeptidase family protein [Alphaproteobacteria bacterium]|nr:peptidoglycan DD-metalloendopeptidase family protein [Alphaproteobacteria bacterium]
MLGLEGPPATAAPPEGDAKGGKIEAVERALEKAEDRTKALDRKAGDIAEETAALSRSLVALAGEARALETRTAELQARIKTIARLEREKRRSLGRQHARLGSLLGALQRIARNPPEALLAYGTTPEDTLRSALLLKSILPQLEAQAATLRAELDALHRLRRDARQRAAALETAAAALAAKRRKVDALIARKRALARTTRQEQERAKAESARLAAQANTLKTLLQNIEKDRKKRKTKRETAPRHRPKPSPAPARKSAPAPAPDGQLAARATPRSAAAPARRLTLGPVPSIRKARGRLAPPVVGRIVARYGAKRGSGSRSKGLHFATAPGAQVVAPHDGHVVFAGPFRGYGRLLIIDHGEGYHSLLAGLGRIDVAVNQRLLAGEPIGIMAPSGKGRPRLYLELRRKGRPFDPRPWLAATPTDKASG